MLTRSCLIFIGAAAVVLAEPRVTYVVNSAAQVGVSVLTAADPGFEAEMAAFALPPTSSLPQIEDVKPYMVIVKNDSSSSVARVSLRYELSYADRSARIWTLTLGIGRTDGVAFFKPGTHLLAFPGIRNVAPGAAVAMPEQLTHEASMLREAKEVVVVLDAVIFDTGLIIGPDKNGNSVRYQAEQQAVRDILGGLRGLKAGGAAGTQAVREYLDRVAAVSPSHVLPVPDDARDKAFHYQGMQKALASWFSARGFRLDDCIAYLTSLDAGMKDLHR